MFSLGCLKIVLVTITIIVIITLAIILMLMELIIVSGCYYSVVYSPKTLNRNFRLPH